MIELRPYREDDRAVFVALVTDPEVMRSMDGPLEEGAAQALFDAFLRGAGCQCARAAEVDAAYIGHAFLVEAKELGGVELGFIVLPGQRGLGHGTAIARELVRIGFEELDLPQVLATVDEDNAASIRVLQKAGFEKLGTRHDEDGPYRLFAIDGTRRHA